MSILVVLSLVALVALVAACGGTSTVSPSPDETAAASLDPGLSTSDPVPSDGSATAAPDPATTEPPASADPSEPPSEAPSPSAAPGAADGCTGTAENRDFFAAVADAVDWPVYCPVLAGRWFVESGQYRLAGGGWLEIAYRGPGGARIVLREGAYCDGDDCAPGGTDLGDAAFGDLTGVVRDVGDGRFAVLVDPAAAVSWELVSFGLAEVDVRAIAADLTLVGG